MQPEEGGGGPGGRRERAARPAVCWLAEVRLRALLNSAAHGVAHQT